MKPKLICFFHFLLIIPGYCVRNIHQKTAYTPAYKGYRLEECLLRSQYVLFPGECAQYCLHDSLCQSFNLGSHTGLQNADLCELNSCTKRENHGDLKLETHFTYYELLRQTDVHIGNKDKPTLVPKTSNAHITTREENENSRKERKCSDLLSTDLDIKSHEHKIHKILDDNRNVIDVLCYLNHNLKRAWTLVMSFSRPNYLNEAINEVPLTKNHPIAESFPNFNRYRMSQTRMKYIRNHTTSWSTVCNFTGAIDDRRDTARGSFSEFDPLRYTTTPINGSEGKCIRVSYINIQGETCSNCTSFWIQSNDKIFHARRGRIDNFGCTFNEIGDLDEDGKFGYYERSSNKTKNFGCTMGPNSTTSLWFGE